MNPQARTLSTPFENLFLTLPVPESWQEVPMSDEDPDFRDPAVLMPLAVYKSPHEAMIFGAAVRPAYEDGGPRQWLAFICREQHLEVEHFFPVEIGTLEGVGCCARQDSEAGPVRLVSALYRTHGAIFTISAAAPEPLWESFGAMLERMVRISTLTVRPPSRSTERGAYKRFLHGPGIDLEPRLQEIEFDSKHPCIDAAAFESMEGVAIDLDRSGDSVVVTEIEPARPSTHGGSAGNIYYC